MQSKISVFITSFNQSNYLVEAIESVLQQTMRPFEIIIVDDCSTDDSKNVIEKYQKKYPDLIRPFYQKENIGIPQNKAFAMGHVRGDFVTYLDGDDRFLPKKLEKEIETLNNNSEAKIVYSNIYYIDKIGKRTGIWIENNIKPPTGYVFCEAFSRNFPKGSLFRNEIIDFQCIKKVGAYDKAFAIYEDWELRIRLTKHYKVAYHPEPLTEYRKHPGGISNRSPSEHLQVMKRIYEKNKSLLRDLTKQERNQARNRLYTAFAGIACQTAGIELEKGNKNKAFKYWLESLSYDPLKVDYKLLAKIMVPEFTYKQIKNIRSAIRGQKKI